MLKTRLKVRRKTSGKSGGLTLVVISKIFNIKCTEQKKQRRIVGKKREVEGRFPVTKRCDVPFNWQY